MQRLRQFVRTARLAQPVWIPAIGLACLFLPNAFAQELKPDVRRIQARLEYLGSDELEGRGAGTQGGEKAARFIAETLAKAGLQPLGRDGGYFQFIPLASGTTLPSSDLRILTGSNNLRLEYRKDYLLLRTGAQTFVPAPAPAVFAGYGIVAPEFDYNSYQDLDVSGKVVVLLSGEPQSETPGYFAGPASTVYSDPEAKHRLAIARGARGTILIPSRSEGRKGNWDWWVDQFGFDNVTLAYGPVGALSVLMHPQAAASLFEGAPHSLEEVMAFESQEDMIGFELKSRISFRGEFSERQLLGRNVAGMLEGNGRKASYVLLSAHYDGLGIGPAKGGDAVYNGVADNAIGVAALLETADLLAAGPRPERSMVFLFTDGEEKGLLGSTYYGEHPLVPLHRTVANLNIDGIASFDRFRDVFGVGGDLSSLGEILRRYAQKQGLAVSHPPSEFEYLEAFLRSDQVAFAEVGVPSILVVEGSDLLEHSKEEGLLHMRKWMKEVYHSPFDDLAQPLNYDAVRQHVEFLAGFARYLAGLPDEPEWMRGSPYAQARLQSIAEQR